MYAEEKPIGLFKGFSPVPRELEVEIIVPHGSADLPRFGEFILVEMEPDKAAVGRIIHYHPTGPLAMGQGESYIAEMGRSEKKFPEAVRELVLRYSMKVALLGILKKKETGFEFVAGVRSLAKLGMPVRRPSLRALQYLANVNLDLRNQSTVVFGHYALATEEHKEIKVHFSIDRLKSKRSFVFARAGYGKSNLIKYLLSKLYESPPNVGLLIFDPEGEYALPHKTEGDRLIPGLASLPELRKRMRYYTLRELGEDYRDIHAGGVKVNFCDFSPRAILAAFVPPEKHDQVWANWLKGLKKENWKKLVKLLVEKEYRATEDEIAQTLGRRIDEREKKKEKDVSIIAIKNNVIPPIERLHDPDSTLARDLLNDLRDSKIVIVDISLLTGEDGLAIAELLMEKVFYNNVEALTAQEEAKKARTLVVLEEAQAILGAKNLSDRSIFVRWVKEGRKYDLGAILVTQQPGAIAHEILSQGDNFFVMHLLNQNDLDVLRRVNAHYAPDILDQIRNEPIKGNCFFWSAPDQSFVISAKVRNFDDVAKEGQEEKTCKEEMAPPTKSSLSPGAQACENAVNCDPQLWVFKVKGRKAYLVSLDYLVFRARRATGTSEKLGIDEILGELKWKRGYWATLAPSRGSEEVVVFPEKCWDPIKGKKVEGEVEITEHRTPDKPSS